MLSTEPIRQLWCTWAVCGYGLAALITLAWRSRGTLAALTASVTGAVLAPLAYLAAKGRYMPEVGVIERAAGLLLHHGTPYFSAAQLAGGGYLRYNPYLPAMTVFGLPHALFGAGLLTDPRLWPGTVFGILRTAAFWVSGVAGPAEPGTAPRGQGSAEPACVAVTAWPAIPVACA